MREQNLIAVEDFCKHHQLQVQFIQVLEERGLVQTTIYEANRYFSADDLSQVEKLARLHRELDIHPEDLDVVSNLVSRLEHLQQELRLLKSRLDFYERMDQDQ